jgi:hypothetical protein
MPVLGPPHLQPGSKMEVISPEQDPRSSPSFPAKAYAIKVPFQLAPMFFQDFLELEPVSKDEFTELRARLRRFIAVA